MDPCVALEAFDGPKTSGIHIMCCWITVGSLEKALITSEPGLSLGLQ